MDQLLALSPGSASQGSTFISLLLSLALSALTRANVSQRCQEAKHPALNLSLLL